MKKVALHNLGCKVNAYETEAMQEMLEHAGYEIVPFQEGADIYVINTCTVTNIADRKSRQMLHRARKMNPDAVVVAAGCYVQAQAEKQVIDPCIDIVLGNNKKQDLLTALQAYEEAHGDLREVIDINHTKEYENLHLTKQGEHTRAYIKVQDGCNQFCSYCIIPIYCSLRQTRTKLYGMFLEIYVWNWQNRWNFWTRISTISCGLQNSRCLSGAMSRIVIWQCITHSRCRWKKICSILIPSRAESVQKRTISS